MAGLLIGKDSTDLTGVTGTIGTGVTFPAGHIIQTITNEDTDGATGTPNASSNDATPTWITIVSVNITPSQGTSCFITVDGIIGSSGSGTTGYVWCRVVRGSTIIGQSSTASYDWPSLHSPFGTHLVWQYNRNAVDPHGQDGSTEITYYWQISNQNAGVAVHAGRSDADYNDQPYGSAQSSRITVMEVQS